MPISTVSKKQLQHPWNEQNATALKTQNDAIVAAANLGTIAAGALTADAGGRAVMASGYFTEAAATDKFAAQAITGALLKNSTVTATQLANDAVTTLKILDANVTTAKLATGVIAASAGGRALFATGVFDEATATNAFAAGAIVGTLLKAKAVTASQIADTTITATQLASDAVTTAKILNANVTAAKLAAVLCGAPTTRSGPGAIPITAPTCLVTTTGTGDALTIADGAHTGQRLTLVHVVDGGTGVITQTTGAKLTAAIATITLTNAYDTLTLEWSGTVWNPVGWSGATAIVNT